MLIPKPRLVHAGCVCPGLCWTLENFFFVNFKNAAVDEGFYPSKKVPSLDFSKTLELGLMFSLNVVIQIAARSFSCEQSNSEYFLDR